MKSNYTEGEKRFISFCDTNGYHYDRIAEESIPSPDFLLHISETEHLTVEVKDFEENKEETTAIQHYKQNGFATWNSQKLPGERIRNKIEGSKRQLEYQKGEYPSLLLLYDNRSEIVSIVSEYEISVAMYGLECRFIQGEQLLRIHGPNKKLTMTEKTYISYIGILDTKGLITMYENYICRKKTQY